MSSTQVGRYALVKLIGRGGMADVWVGKAYGAGGFEKIVAIKLLAPDNVDKEEYQRALTDEARVLVHLKHPNIVDVYDLNFEAENPYLVMEYVEGAELRDILRALRAKGRTMPLPIAAYIVLEISKALSHAHDRRDPQTGEPLRIVHRDVSPSNVLISSQGDIKLSDFGIAKSSLQSSRTQVGLIKGKFRYMSPEQAAGKALDRRSDIFSLGLIFYECLFRTPAYEDSSDVKVLQLAGSGSITIPEDCDPALKRILQKILSKAPEDRYADLAAFRKELAEVAARLGGIADRDQAGDFLSRLDLPQLRQSISARKHAEDWNPQPTSQILTEQGTIQTLADAAGRPRRRWPYWAASVVGLVAVMSVVAALSRNPRQVADTDTSAASKPADEKRQALKFEVYASDKPSEMFPVFRPILDQAQQFLKQELKRDVAIDLIITPDYYKTINNFVGGKADIARIGPASYVTIKDREPGVSLIAMELVDGKKFFNGYIATSNKNSIGNLKDLKGKTFAFGDELSTIGRYLAQALLVEAGITQRKLKHIKYLDRHDKVAEAVLSGDFDAGAIKEETVNRYENQGEGLRRIATLKSVTKPWIARKGLSPEIMKAMQKFLLQLNDPKILKDLDNCSGFTLGADEDYTAIRNAMKVAERF